jgi:hypothetical protein
MRGDSEMEYDSLIEALSPPMRDIVKVVMSIKRVRLEVGEIFETAIAEVEEIWRKI